nr:glutaminase A [Sediminibacillus massiliensis]
MSKELLEDWLLHVKDIAEIGKVADYIPALASQDPRHLAVGIHRVSGQTVYAGKADHLFTLQSVSKVIALALALLDNGEERVFSHVGMEPSGDPFHSIVKLETSKPSKPLNPMINAGALAVTDLIQGNTPDEKVGRILSFIHDLTSDKTIHFNQQVAESEFQSAFLNRSLCYFMKQHGVINGEVEDVLDAYTKQCSIEMNIKQLARLGAVFANDGYDLETLRPIIPRNLARICKSFMVTCGMYDASGEFAIKIGIPAKSGVSGAIMCSVKHYGGIAVFGPALDEKGNSVAGLKLLEYITKQGDLSIY